MKKHTMAPLLLILLFATVTNNSLAQTTSKRLSDIEATFPVIDKIFKEYAEKNHFPGFVFGLVVDGKLIHTSNADRMLINVSVTCLWKISTIEKCL